MLSFIRAHVTPAKMLFSPYMIERVLLGSLIHSPMRLPEELLERARDIHSEAPSHRIKLDRVGSFGLKVPVEFKGFLLLAEADVWVSLPEGRRGVDLSRQVEAIYELSNPPKDPFSLCREAAISLLEKLNYADSSGVSIRFDAPLQDGESLKYYRVEISSIASDEIINKIRVEILGMTACPCTAELIRAYKSSEIAATHTQRSLGILEVSTKAEHPDPDKLASIIERAMSSPLRTYTKRPDEGGLVIQSLSNARLAEDVVREMIHLFLEEFGHLPEDTHILAAVRSMESVHMHDIYAERSFSLDEIRKEISSH
jgi:GTP cyclohydrolase-4